MCSLASVNYRASGRIVRQNNSLDEINIELKSFSWNEKSILLFLKEA